MIVPFLGIMLVSAKCLKLSNFIVFFYSFRTVKRSHS